MSFPCTTVLFNFVSVFEYLYHVLRKSVLWHYMTILNGAEKLIEEGTDKADHLT